jgi:negative regulator of flagellin synthesis FlgM
MAIINYNLNNTTINKAGQSKQATTQNKEVNTASATSNRTAATDSIALTESAKLIQHLEEQLKLLPVVDTEKVSHVKENLNSGNYQISSDRIADKFYQYESSLLNVI